MDIKQAIKFNLNSSNYLVNGYLADLSDGDLLIRPVPGTNHIAWQLGHLIAAERMLVEKAVPGSMRPLPEGFAERHKKSTAGSDNPADFLTKAEYLRLAESVRANTLEVVEKLAEGDADKSAGQGGPPFLQTVGDTLLFISGHWLMHAGQWAIVRRKLGRAPLF
ncbi:MAG: DinB family protein [Pirellulales bacterium]|nr:DinB family protein [Pirellulales bacterium]